MMKKRLIFVLIIVVLALPTMILAPLAGAQEGPKPEAVGLRPDAPLYAQHGPYWVGMREFEAETDFHPTTVTLWYPALNPSALEEDVTYTTFWSVAGSNVPILGHAILDASLDVSGGPYPLVIFAHGGNTVRLMSSWLCEHVASHGFVVMAIDYADSWRSAPGNENRLSAVSRPLDVTWQIDLAAQLTDVEGDMAGIIDTEHIAIMGQSYGGYTAYTAAGARMANLESPTGWCSQYPDLRAPAEIGAIRVCPTPQQMSQSNAAYTQDAGLSTVPDGLWPSWGDGRVDAIVTLAPSVLEFDAEGTQDVSVPALVLVGSADHWVMSDVPLFRQYAYENLGSPHKAMAVFENAGHTIFHNTGREITWATEAGAFFAVSDPVWDMDRVHDLTDHLTTAFLLAELYGDDEAAAALAPDAVQFPGITYETTGF